MSPEYRALAELYTTGIGITVLGAGAAFYWSRSEGARSFVERHVSVLAIVVGTFYLGSMLWMGWGKAAALNHYADRATHLEILMRSVRGLGLTSPMSASFFTGSHWFAAHFTPIIYLAYWPFFRLVPVPYTLHVLQTLYLMSAAVPIGLFAARRLGTSAGWLFAASFLLYPTVQYINLYGTAYLDLSIPILAWALYALEENRTVVFLVAAALAMATREEAGLVVAALGLYAFVRGRRRLGTVVAIAGLLWFVVAIRIIIPAFRTNDALVYLRNYQEWGDTPAEIVRFVVLHPFATMRRLFSVMRVANTIMYLLPLAFLPLLDPLGLLVCVPNVLTTFMSGSVTNYSFNLYYLSPTVPVLFVSAVRGAARLREYCGLDSAVPIATAVLAAALGANYFFGPSPISRQFWNQDYKIGVFHTTSYYRAQYVPTEASDAARRIVALVPDYAQVSAEQHLLPLLYDRKRILVFPTLDSGIDYVVIDRGKREKAGWAATYEDFRIRPEYYYALVEQDKSWEVVAQDHGAKLFRKRVR